MNLYLVSRTDRVSWDEYDSFVIACKDEVEARNTYPDSCNWLPDPEKNGAPVWDGEKWADKRGWAPGSGWADNPKSLNVMFLGKAAKGVKGIICASFNAG